MIATSWQAAGGRPRPAKQDISAAFERFPVFLDYPNRMPARTLSALFPGTLQVLQYLVLSALPPVRAFARRPSVPRGRSRNAGLSSRGGVSPGPCPNQQAGSLPASRAACAKSNISRMPSSLPQISDRLEVARATGRFQVVPGLRGLDGDGPSSTRPGAPQSARPAASLPPCRDIRGEAGRADPGSGGSRCGLYQPRSYPHCACHPVPVPRHAQHSMRTSETTLIWEPSSHVNAFSTLRAAHGALNECDIPQRVAG